VKSKVFTSYVVAPFFFLTIFALASVATTRCEAIVVADTTLPRIAANTNQHPAGIVSECCWQP
jgi:hypothetical protein